MNNRRSGNQNKVGATAPVDFTLAKVLNNIRERNFQAAPERLRFTLTAREMMILGRLRSNWKDVVGIQMAHKTCPQRLIKGRLFLSVSDSQWLQTLVFIKPRILEKLQETFPELKINDIVGRPGEIPSEFAELVKEAEWPEWQEIADIDLPEKLDNELVNSISRCRKKLSARIQGLKERGFQPCRVCQSGLTDSENQICAFCLSQQRKTELKPVVDLLYEMPWLDYEEILGFFSDLRSYEYEKIKADQIAASLELINDTALLFKEMFDKKLLVKIKKEMVRAIVLQTGCMPDQIDLYHLKPGQQLHESWSELLIMSEGEV